jgi:Fic family protein
MKFDRNRPFNALPDLPPKGVLLESVPILRKCISARAALAELKGRTEMIPDPDILIRSIGLQEARVSSEIENVVTTTDDLYQALAGSIDAADPATKEVLRYQDALLAGARSVQKRALLTTNLFCEIASIIRQVDTNVRAVPGTKIVDGGKRTVYTPPEGETIIRSKLTKLEQFINTPSELDPLVRLALMHYQFEAIHPFADGNGRTGRIVNILFLLQQGLLSLPILYLSRYFIEHKSEYYSGLKTVTENQAWEEWILFVLNGVEQTAVETRKRIVEIKDIMELTQKEVREKLPRLYSKDLVELLFYHPYCKIRFVEEHSGVTRQTAANQLKALEEIGVLVGIKMGREMYYINRRLLNSLKS